MSGKRPSGRGCLWQACGTTYRPVRQYNPGREELSCGGRDPAVVNMTHYCCCIIVLTWRMGVLFSAGWTITAIWFYADCLQAAGAHTNFAGVSMSGLIITYLLCIIIPWTPGFKYETPVVKTFYLVVVSNYHLVTCTDMPVRHYWDPPQPCDTTHCHAGEHQTRPITGLVVNYYYHYWHFIHKQAGGKRQWACQNSIVLTTYSHSYPQADRPDSVCSKLQKDRLVVASNITWRTFPSILSRKPMSLPSQTLLPVANFSDLILRRHDQLNMRTSLPLSR